MDIIAYLAAHKQLTGAEGGPESRERSGTPTGHLCNTSRTPLIIPDSSKETAAPLALPKAYKENERQIDLRACEEVIISTLDDKDTRICARCKQRKPAIEFFTKTRKRKSYCKNCTREYSRELMKIRRKVGKCERIFGQCEICGHFQESLHRDHNHITGNARGLLCQKCNFGLGNFDDNTEMLLRAAMYLKKYE